MQPTLYTLILLLLSFNAFGQASYSGFIDQYPIELVTNIYSAGVASAFYAYSNYDEPIVINGTLKQDKLTLNGKDSNGKNKAILIFENFDTKRNQFERTWKDLNSNKYFESGFSGISLEFDGKTKRIHERDQYCAGSIVTTAEYKVVNNKMVLVQKRCFKWDDKKEELVERKIEDCQ